MALFVFEYFNSIQGRADKSLEFLQQGFEVVSRGVDELFGGTIGGSCTSLYAILHHF